MSEHFVLCARVLHPPATRLEIHPAHFPALDGIPQAVLKTLFLLVLIDRKPVLYEHDSATHQHALKFGTTAQKLQILGLSAKSHHVLHASPVVPTSIKKYDLARRRQMGYISLKVPLRLFTLRGRRQSDHAANTRIERIGDPLNRPTLEI